MKITGKTVLLSFEHDVKVGDLSATLQAHTWLSDPHSENFDIEFADITNITFRGVKIEGYANWKLFKKFHMDMGIDYDKYLDEEFDKVFTKEAILELIKKEKLKF